MHVTLTCIGHVCIPKTLDFKCNTFQVFCRNSTLDHNGASILNFINTMALVRAISTKKPPLFSEIKIIFGSQRYVFNVNISPTFE